MELWMKVIAYELRVAMDEMAADDVPEATLRLQRVREIERVLVDQAFTRRLPAAGVSLFEIHKDRHTHQVLYGLVQGLMDVDAWFQRFREAHYYLVKRVIGSEVRSLRGIPASRLEHTSQEPLFSELSSVINDMTRLDWPAF